MNKRIQKIKEKLNCLSLNETKIFKDFKKHNYYPKTFDEIFEVLKLKAKKKDNNLNDINVSDLKFSPQFTIVDDFYKENNFFVDEWDVSNFISFYRQFKGCYHFDSELSSWDVSNSKCFIEMFAYCKNFNRQISNFDVSNAEDSFYSIFYNCYVFNQEVYNFKFNRKVKILLSFFSGCQNFNQDVSMWNVSNIESFDYMFRETRNFKQDLSNWDVSSAQSWKEIFFASKMEKHPELMPVKFRNWKNVYYSR